MYLLTFFCPCDYVLFLLQRTINVVIIVIIIIIVIVTISSPLLSLSSLLLAISLSQFFLSLPSLLSTSPHYCHHYFRIIVAKSSAGQRAGRAGRMQPGKCFRLITESKFNSLEEYTIPEMQRTEISGAILQLKALGIDDVLHFDFLSSPPSESMIYSLELLYSLGALDDNCKLTEMGEKMSGKRSCTNNICDNISAHIYHTCT
jgi:hypothetical protein